MILTIYHGYTMKKHCSFCGVLGHNKRTCPQLETAWQRIEQYQVEICALSQKLLAAWDIAPSMICSHKLTSSVGFISGIKRVEFNIIYIASNICDVTINFAFNHAMNVEIEFQNIGILTDSIVAYNSYSVSSKETVELTAIQRNDIAKQLNIGFESTKRMNLEIIDTFLKNEIVSKGYGEYKLNYKFDKEKFQHHLHTRYGRQNLDYGYYMTNCDWMIKQLNELLTLDK